MQVFKQHGLKVFENKVLREICGNEGTGKDVLVHNRKVQERMSLCTMGRYRKGCPCAQQEGTGKDVLVHNGKVQERMSLCTTGRYRKGCPCAQQEGTQGEQRLNNNQS
jgi:cold shock CspA family protein